MQKSNTLYRLFCIPAVCCCLLGFSQKTNKPVKAIDIDQTVVEATIAGVQKSIKEGKCSCEQIVEAYLKRIAAYDQPTKLNSIILTNPNALITARSLDKEWQRTKKMRPLF